VTTADVPAPEPEIQSDPEHPVDPTAQQPPTTGPDAAARAWLGSTAGLAVRRFVVEVLAAAAVLLAIILLLSVPTIQQPFPFGPERQPIVQLRGAGALHFLLAAAILVIVERFVRPIVVAFTGRVILSTMGLFLVVANAIVLWVASIFAPDIAIFAEPQLLWLFVFAALYTLLTSLVDAVLGLNRPRITPDGATAAIWRFLESLPTPRRNLIIENLRLQQVYDAIYAAALDSALQTTPVGHFRATFSRRILGEEDEWADTTGAERLRLLLQQLGPTYVKIGQMVASRGDVLPADVIEELSKLQSDAAPFPWEEARTVIRSELGRDPEVLYASIEHEPFAAASTAQVHRATLHDGTLVAVKVQRPQIVAKTKADLGVITELAAIAERRISLARKVGVRSLVAEFAGGVLRELDYTNEAYHAKRLADNMKRFPEIALPRIYDDLSGVRVITMDFVKGIKISHADELRAAGFDTSALGGTFIQSVIKQILIDGFFHGDPHPGNLMADPVTKRLVFLDLGLVGQLSSTQRVDLLGLIYAVKEVDIPSIGDGLIALGTPTSGFDEVAFRADIDRLARQYLVYGNATSVGGALTAFMSAVFNNGLRLDSSLTLAIKAVIQAEETARVLSPSVDVADAAVAEAKAALFESLEPERLTKQVQSTGVRLSKELARRAPSLEAAAFKWLDAVNRGKLTVELDTSELNKSIERVEGMGKQATGGIIVVGQLIGTAIAMTILLQPQLAAFTGVAYIAMIVFGITLLVSFFVLFRLVFGGDGDD
jgi:ubiquinone biosynthesis protein